MDSKWIGIKRDSSGKQSKMQQNTQCFRGQRVCYILLHFGVFDVFYVFCDLRGFVGIYLGNVRFN